jgi:hypothetical protein
MRSASRRYLPLRYLPIFAFVLFAGLGINSRDLPQATGPAPTPGGVGPDILGVKTGMSAQEAYTALMNLDPARRVTVSQVPIPALLGDKTAVFGMAPENLNSGGDGSISAMISLPPNAQQVWQVHRQLVSSIHTTVAPILASLRQKYGQESQGYPEPNPTALTWLYDEQGHLANPATAEMTLRSCNNSGESAITVGNINAGNQVVAPGSVGAGYQITGPIVISPLQDPTKNLQCQGIVLVRAGVSGGQDGNGVYNYSLDVTVIDYGIEKRAAYALSGVLAAVASKQRQRQLNNAEGQSVPKL